MPKPIGNMTANIKSNDKVSQRLLAKFLPQSAPGTQQPAGKNAAKVKKYKTRKK